MCWNSLLRMMYKWSFIFSAGFPGGGIVRAVDVFLIYSIEKSAGIVEHPAFLNKPRTVAPVRGFFCGRFFRRFRIRRPGLMRMVFNWGRKSVIFLFR